MADRIPTGPDRTKRSLRPRGIALGLIAVGAIAGIAALATHGAPQAILAFALGGVVLLDAWIARSTLARLQISVINPVDAIAGQRLVYVVQARGITRPVQLVRPAQWPVAPRRAIALDVPDAGAMELSAPGRCIVTHSVFDLVATGPLGLWDATCRVRVWFPMPLSVGPAPLAHDPDWPALRTLPIGETETVARGDDLFRGVRPYVRGDARRSVHWPATAHHGTLMVKERDGLESVAIRIVLHLPMPGVASEYAAARAAWLVEQCLTRGWLVHLVTVEPTAGEPAPPPLIRPYGPVPAPWPFPQPVRTIDQRIDHVARARHQLAHAGVGMPSTADWTGLTRVVSPQGDTWR